MGAHFGLLLWFSRGYQSTWDSTSEILVLVQKSNVWLKSWRLKSKTAKFFSKNPLFYSDLDLKGFGSFWLGHFCVLNCHPTGLTRDNFVKKGFFNCFWMATTQKSGLGSCKPDQIGQILVYIYAKLEQISPIYAKYGKLWPISWLLLL